MDHTGKCLVTDRIHLLEYRWHPFARRVFRSNGSLLVIRFLFSFFQYFEYTHYCNIEIPLSGAWNKAGQCSWHCRMAFIKSPLHSPFSLNYQLRYTQLFCVSIMSVIKGPRYRTFKWFSDNRLFRISPNLIRSVDFQGPFLWYCHIWIKICGYELVVLEEFFFLLMSNLFSLKNSGIAGPCPHFGGRT